MNTGHRGESEIWTRRIYLLESARDQPSSYYPHQKQGLMDKPILPDQRVVQKILVIRGQKVILDAELASLYKVETRVLTQAVKRNRDRFPEDFMFQLSKEEFDNLRSQAVSTSWGGRRYPPYAFTEQGVAMLSSVLRSKHAVQVNIAIMRAFVQLREILEGDNALAHKLVKLENKVDENFQLVFEAIRALMEEPEKEQRRIGFIMDGDD
jgi:hypothetical protein